LNLCLDLAGILQQAFRIQEVASREKMSRWLSSVNNLLEKLDDRVETVVEERAVFAHQSNERNDLEGEEHDKRSAAALDRILAKRGLHSVHSQDEDSIGRSNEFDGDVELGGNSSTAVLTPPHPVASAKVITSTTGSEDWQNAQFAEEVLMTGQNNERGDLDEAKRSPTPPVDQFGKETKAQVIDDMRPTNEKTDDWNNSSPNSPPVTPPKNTKNSESEEALHTKIFTPTTNQASSSTGPRHPGGTPNRTPKERELLLEMKEAQKESRTLRRHIVSLNEQLEAAESELNAQRNELVRAAERMEKDRIRAKEDKEASQKQQAQEIVVLKQQNEKHLKEQQARFEELLEGYRTRLKEEENKRKQEGGDWNKEISQAIDREQEMRQAVSALEDEKAVLLSRISTLEGQQNALGSRLESLTQAADKAMEREREAEDRLDSLLSQHARQISQRQVNGKEWSFVDVLSREKNSHSFLSGKGG
jgi:hypothetical protein